jgi:hypothetical protein
MGRPVPLWEMASWNDEWASRIVLLLILVIIVQYFCGHGFGLSHDLWRSFLVGVFYTNLYVITSSSLCRRTALWEWCPAFIVTLSCCLPCLSLLPLFLYLHFVVALTVGYPFWFLLFYLILRFLLAIFRGVCNELFDTVYLQPGALGIKQSSYVISRTRLIFLTTCTLFYQ